MSSLIKWIVLGSSSGNPSRERACSGYLLKIDNQLFMFDCGSGVASSLLRFGFAPLDVQAIFISHTHSDHISDLSLFIQLLYLLKRQEDMTVYLPEEAVVPYRNHLNTVYLFPEKFDYRFNLAPIGENVEFSNIDLKIIPHPNDHNRTDRTVEVIEKYGFPNKMESYSFEIIAADKKIFYTSDLGGLNDIAGKIDGAHLLITETTHIDLSDLRQLAEEKNVGRVLLTHISDDSYADIASFAEKSTGKTKFITAYDGLILAV